MQKRLDMVGIGVAVFDVVMVVDQLPTEEAVVRAEQRAIGIGGGISVAAATAAILGGRVAFADLLGHDPMSELILTTLQAAGVDVGCVQRFPDQIASVATVWVSSASGARTIVFAPGSASELPWSDDLAATVAASRIVHLNGRHLEACRRAVEVAKANDVLVSFDGGAHRYRDEILPLVRASDVLIVSEHFASAHWLAQHSPRQPPAHADLLAFLQAEFDATITGVTCGQHGSWLGGRDGQRWHQPAIATEAVDTTGCGDTYHGAFLLALAKGLEPRECGQVASLVAAENAGQLGSFGFLAEPVRDRLYRQYPKLRP